MSIRVTRGMMEAYFLGHETRSSHFEEVVV